MAINVDVRSPDTVVVGIEGRLDLLTAGDVKQQFADSVQAGQKKVVVNLAAVTFVDSSGLGALIGGLKTARLAGGDLRIAEPGEQARLILELTTLNRVLRPYSTVQEALAGF